jgi:hypothetical protein
VQVSTCLVDAYDDYNCFNEVSFCRVEGFKLEKIVAIKFCVKLMKTTIKTFEMLKSMYGEEQVFLNGIKGLKKGNSCYKTMNRNAALQLPEQKNRRKSFKTVWPKIQL